MHGAECYPLVGRNSESIGNARQNLSGTKTFFGVAFRWLNHNGWASPIDFGPRIPDFLSRLAALSNFMRLSLRESRTRGRG